MEQEIQHLRKLAVLVVLFSDDDQTTKSPDIIKCMAMMWLKLGEIWPHMYIPVIATRQWKERDETVVL